MEVIDILTIIGYTITVFSLGYALGKDYAKKQKRPPLASQTLTVVTYTTFQYLRLTVYRQSFVFL